MSDPVWNSTTQSWDLTSESATVTPGATPVNTNTVIGYPDNELVCDRTGFVVSRAEGLVREWNGLMVRKKSFEKRHPQDFVRSRGEQQTGSIRPEQPDTFLSTNEVSVSDL